jgi:hypothetical protein
MKVEVGGGIDFAFNHSRTTGGTFDRRLRKIPPSLTKRRESSIQPRIAPINTDAHRTHLDPRDSRQGKLDQLFVTIRDNPCDPWWFEMA